MRVWKAIYIDEQYVQQVEELLTEMSNAHPEYGFDFDVGWEVDEDGEYADEDPPEHDVLDYQDGDL